MTVPQSKIRVDSIQNTEGGPVNISYGATCATGSIFAVSGGTSIAGVVTAISFEGDGSSLTNIPVTQIGNAIGLTYIT